MPRDPAPNHVVDEEAGGLLTRPLLVRDADATPAPAPRAPVPPPPVPAAKKQTRRILFFFQKPPDWLARGLRVAVALSLFLTVTPEHILPPGPLLRDYADEVQTALVWAGATTVVVAASPLIGRVAQVSFERTLGTVLGGVLGVLAYDLLLPGILSRYPPGTPERERAEAHALAAFAAAIAVMAAFLSDRLKLDQSMRLLVMNFLLVVRNVHAELGSLGTAIIRTSGILAGVYVYSALSVLLLPKSASISALRQAKAALEALAGLNVAAWASLPSPSSSSLSASCPASTAAAAGAAGGGAPRDNDEEREATGGAGTGAAAGGGSKLWRESQRDLAAGLSKTYAAIGKTEEYAALALRERYVWHFRGHYVFVPKIMPWGFVAGAFGRLLGGSLGGRKEQPSDGPGEAEGEGQEAAARARRERAARRRHLPFVGWRLPQGELDDLLQSMARSGRLVWALHLSFQDGFDSETLSLLRRAFGGGGGGGGGKKGENNNTGNNNSNTEEDAAAAADDDPDILRRMDRSLGAALSTLAAAFPSGGRSLRADGLLAFQRAVDSALDLDAQERERRMGQRRELERLLLRRAKERERRTAERVARFERTEGRWAAGLAGRSGSDDLGGGGGGGGGGGTTAPPRTPPTPAARAAGVDDDDGGDDDDDDGADADAPGTPTWAGGRGSSGGGGGGGGAKPGLLAAALAARLAARERRAAAAAASGGVFGASYATVPAPLTSAAALAAQLRRAESSTSAGEGTAAAAAALASSSSPSPLFFLQRARSALLGPTTTTTATATTNMTGAPQAHMARSPRAHNHHDDASADAALAAAAAPPLLEFPTHAAEVRWASLLFVADELADELETLYLAAGAVMETLPAPPA